MAAEQGTLQGKLQAIFDKSREENQHYSSAEYKQPGQQGQSGMANRLDAYEQAMLVLARALDARE